MNNEHEHLIDNISYNLSSTTRGMGIAEEAMAVEELWVLEMLQLPQPEQITEMRMRTTGMDALCSLSLRQESTYRIFLHGAQAQCLALFVALSQIASRASLLWHPLHTSSTQTFGYSGGGDSSSSFLPMIPGRSDCKQLLYRFVETATLRREKTGSKGNNRDVACISEGRKMRPMSNHEQRRLNDDGVIEGSFG
jgi:hypothetical protein